MTETRTANFNPKPREPNNTEAEAAIIGACLASQEAFNRLRGALSAKHFYEITYADTWAHMEEMAAQNRRADLVTLSPVLKERKLGDALAIDHLGLLVQSYGGRNAPDNSALDAYADEVKRYAAQRFLAKIGRDLTTRALSVEPDLVSLAAAAISEVDDILAQTDSRITFASAGTFADIALANFLDDSAPAGILTGLRDLDAKTGGLYRGEMSLVGGRPGQGKTTLAGQVVLNVANAGVGTLFLSLEMGIETVGTRLISSMAYLHKVAIPYEAFRTDKRVSSTQRKITADMLKEAERSAKRLHELPLMIETDPAYTVGRIASLIRRSRANYERRGIDLAFVVIDYLGLVKPNETYRGQKVHEIAEISAELRSLAKRENVHLMALHQLNRDVEREDDKRPHMHHLRDSGSLEQDADLIIFPFRESYYLEKNSFVAGSDQEKKRLKRLREVQHLMELNIEKHRHGPTGTVECFCDIACNRVGDFNPE